MDPLDYSNPPPAYSDQEFDRKTSQATEASLRTPQPPSPEISEERWAEIEEAAFQAAIAASLAEAEGNGGARSSEGESSRSVEPGPPGSSLLPASPTAPRRFPTVKPLRIEKKTRSPQSSVDLKNEKEKLKWLPGAEDLWSGAHGHNADEDDIAPPPFAEAPPCGSAYHKSSCQDVGYTYDPPDCAGPSPIESSHDLSQDNLLSDLDALSISSSVSDYHTTTPALLQPTPMPPAAQAQHPINPSNGFHRQSMPVSPSQEPNEYKMVHRARSFAPQPSSGPSSSYGRAPTNPPMMSFNPSVAYGKTPFARLHTPPPAGAEGPEQEVVYRANAFYNAAVSSHLTPQRPTARDQRPSYSGNHFANGYDNSYSTASSPGYMTMSSACQSQQRPYTAAPTPTDPNWGQPYPGTNRPISVYSTDIVYSTGGVSHPQYLNTFQAMPQQHSGPPPTSWAAGSQQYQNNRYGQW